MPPSSSSFKSSDSRIMTSCAKQFLYRTFLIKYSVRGYWEIKQSDHIHATIDHLDQKKRFCLSCFLLSVCFKTDRILLFLTLPWCFGIDSELRKNLTVGLKILNIKVRLVTYMKSRLLEKTGFRMSTKHQTWACFLKKNPKNFKFELLEVVHQVYSGVRISYSSYAYWVPSNSKCYVKRDNLSKLLVFMTWLYLEISY